MVGMWYYHISTIWVLCECRMSVNVWVEQTFRTLSSTGGASLRSPIRWSNCGKNKFYISMEDWKVNYFHQLHLAKKFHYDMPLIPVSFLPQCRHRARRSPSSRGPAWPTRRAATSLLTYILSTFLDFFIFSPSFSNFIQPNITLGPYFPDFFLVRLKQANMS